MQNSARAAHARSFPVPGNREMTRSHISTALRQPYRKNQVRARNESRVRLRRCAFSLCRSVLRVSKAGLALDFDIAQSALDTSSVVCLRSPIQPVPAGISGRRFRNFRRHGFGHSGSRGWLEINSWLPTAIVSGDSEPISGPELEVCIGY